MKTLTIQTLQRAVAAALVLAPRAMGWAGMVGL
jgi:hypothetical protein